MTRPGYSLSGRGRTSVSVGGVRSYGRGCESHDTPISRQRFNSFPETQPQDMQAQYQMRSPTPESRVRHPSSGPSSSGSGNVPSSPIVPPATEAPSPPSSENVIINVGLLQEVRTKVEVVRSSLKKPPVFIPSVSTIITKSFKQKQRKKGTAWKCLNQKNVDWYWREFEKHVCWDQPTAIVRACWEHIACTRYSDWFSKLRLRTECPTFCDPVVWNIWKAHWEKETVKEMSMIKAANRRGKEGTTPSIHVGGSKSHLEHLRDAFKATGKMPSLWQHFRDMHQRKDKDGNKVFCDPKSARINEKIEARMGELATDMEARGEPVVIDENRVFLEVMAKLGGVSKGRVYGIGNVVSALNDEAICSSAASVPTTMTPDQMTELVTRLVNQAFSEKMSVVVQSLLQRISQNTQPSRDAPADQSDFGNRGGENGAGESVESGGERNVGVYDDA